MLFKVHAKVTTFPFIATRGRQFWLCRMVHTHSEQAAVLYFRFWSCFTAYSTHSVQFSSVAQSCLTLPPQGLPHARLPCPSPTPGACSDSCPLRRGCHPTISTSIVPLSSCPIPHSQWLFNIGKDICKH